MTGLHVVLVSPPWYPTPPDGYGGIELVVDLLAVELRRRGQRVSVIAAEGSRPGSVMRAPAQWKRDLGRGGERLRELTYAASVVRTMRHFRDIDLVHDHTGFGTLLSLSLQPWRPLVHTVHGPVLELDRAFYGALPDVRLVSLSASQKSAAPQLAWAGCVFNAVDVGALHRATRKDKRGYLLCLARILPDKGQHVAVEVARRTGLRLVLAGKVEPTREGVEYFERHIAPAMREGLVTHRVNVGGLEKADLLAGAVAHLSPIDWEEPFGLSTVEAMVSGTPAVTFRRGAAPELVDEGITGFVVDDADAMVAAVDRIDDIDPAACAEAARRRFGPAAMADGYLAIYERLLSERGRPVPAPPGAPSEAPSEALAASAAGGGAAG